uniref:Putative secreted protein n=1 Tax=Ixodes scapularis TaxID=6945 RepID=A0A4D5RXQ5_IXOSC
MLLCCFCVLLLPLPSLIFLFFINTNNAGFNKESQCFEVLKWQFSVAVKSDAETLCKASRGWEPDSFAEVNGWHVEKYYIFLFISGLPLLSFLSEHLNWRGLSILICCLSLVHTLPGI